MFDLEHVDPGDYSRICVGRNGTAGAGLFDICLPGPPPETLTPTANIDTNVCDVPVAQTDTNATEVCVVAARHIEIGTTLTATGDRPLVLIATEDVVVSVTISVASHNDQVKGAGRDPTFCPNGLRGKTPPASPPLGHAGSGGAGGSFLRRAATAATGRAFRRARSQSTIQRHPRLCTVAVTPVVEAMVRTVSGAGSTAPAVARCI